MTWVFVFLAGAVLLIFSAEKLIGYLVGVASGLRISLFLLAVIFCGVEFDDIVLGVALNVEDQDEVALGVVLGTTLSMTGVVLALAAILTPTKVRIPRGYVVMLAAAPMLMIPFVLTAPLTLVHGVILIALCVVFFAHLVARESKAGASVFRNAEMYEEFAAARRRDGGAKTLGGATTLDSATTFGRATAARIGRAGGGQLPERDAAREVAESIPLRNTRRRSGWSQLGLAIIALAGLIVGAAVTASGTEGILETYRLEGTYFGATIATAVLSIEDIFLTVEPVRRGVPEIGVGNVIGSVVFSVTGKLGVILLAGSIVVTSDVLAWHLPALVVANGLAACLLLTGRLRRWHGFTLLALYLAYWAISFGVFGTAPIDPD
jgi:cation:H+ antiporter